ncbi:MAG: glycosyltransferase family 2 protein [Acidobacteriota bacterium]
MLSVLIVNHNGGDVLLDSLKRLHALGDEGVEREVLLIDNASTDDSLDRVRRDFPTVHVIDAGANLGFGAANNLGAREAIGDHLLLLNSDAWPTPGAIPTLVDTLEADPLRALVAPRLSYPDGRPQFHWAPTTSVLGEALQMVRNRFERHDWIHRLKLGVGWYTGACLLLRRDAFESIGGFDEDYFLYFEDVDLCMRLRQAGWRLADAPSATVVHVKGGSQPSGTVMRWYRDGQRRYYRRHRPTWEQLVLRLKVGTPDA